MSTYCFTHNELIEVFGDEDDGFPGCWIEAVFIEPVGDKQALVQYLEFIDDNDGQPLRETISRKRIRPAPPPQLAFASIRDAKEAHLVETYCDDCWWHAIVHSISTAGVKLAMHECRSHYMLVRDYRLLRPRMEFVNGSWRHAVATREQLLKLNFDEKTIDSAIKAMESAKPVKTCLSLFGHSAGGSAAVPSLDPPKVATDPRVETAPHVGSKRAWQPDDEDDADDGSNTAESDDVQEIDDGSDEQSDRDSAETANQDGATETGEEEPPLKRQRREGKNRVVYVNGFPVLKENMYGLHDEDTMKWQRAFKTGEASIEGVNLQSRQRRLSNAKRDPKPVARQHPTGVTMRLEHNASVRKDSQASEVTRAQYLLRHIDKLKPFTTDQVLKHLRTVAERAETKLEQEAATVTRQPQEILATLREYQLEGVAWLVAQYRRGINPILADEMGLGKTLQTIAFLAHLKFVCRVEGPHLVVVPLSVMSNWLSEFKKWCPAMRVVRLHSNDPDERKRLVREVLGKPTSLDVAVTTYDMVNSQHFGDCLKHHLMWRYVVLDEGHKVKNEETRVSRGMRQIRRQHVLMLTGTPIQNNLHELFALLNFMYPDIFTDASKFDKAFNLSKNKVDQKHLEAAHYLLRPFMLRRLKEEVDVRLPPKLETRIQCPLSEMQTFWYRRLLLRDSKLLQEMEAADAQAAKLAAKRQLHSERQPEMSTSRSAKDAFAWKAAMNLLVQLRKVCNHPFMFKDAEPDFDGESAPEELVTGSGKMMILDRMLNRLHKQGHRVVLFSQFNIMLDIIEDYLVSRGFNFRRLDGSTNRIQRMIDIEQFNMPGSKIFIYILCTRAGGLGVNLQTADTCILFDSDWNPQWDLQAMARVHRIGQTRPVHIYRLVTGGTVEDRIQRRAEAKLYLDQMVNRGSTSSAEQLEGLTTSEMLSMLRFGADRIFRNDQGVMPTEAELDAIMDRSSMVTVTDAAVAAGTGAAAAAESPVAKLDLETADSSGDLSDDVDVGIGNDPSGNAAAAGAVAVPRGPRLVEQKHTALDFDAEAPPVDTFVFQGLDFRAFRERAGGTTLGNIAADFWEEKKKRERRERLIDVGGFKVLRNNNYTMEEGMLQSPGQQRGKEANAKARGTQRAGVDYDHADYCLACWGGGELVCCDHCPAVFHLECLGLTKKDIGNGIWVCPHHTCATCKRGTCKAGGLLFRCEMCPNAYCEDDLPANYHMVGSCELFQALGQRHPKQACFIHCSDACKQLYEGMKPEIEEMIQEAAAARR
ncbi:hypothetical protein Vretifemale_646 [Volvox reticuliferus]|uniref:Uncharacterized protein n=2 Tax=Volvox reticuliferus TaxID=1737510 RepID=A0A8J4BVQ2_9CHLO|nr:hypothetical protein Vretifemale_646 [Volvox reticuliferus]